MDEREERLQKATRVTRELFESLGVQDSAHGPLLPATLRARNASGGFEEKEIMLMTLDEPRRNKARVRAREWALKQKLDLDRDKDLVDQLENFEILAYVIREPVANPDKTHDQIYPTGEHLYQVWKKAPLTEIWGILDAWENVTNPRFGDLDRDELWRVAQEVAKKGVRPLMSIGGIEQHNFILLMAKAALSSPMAPSWLHSPTTSQPLTD
jgi:hypothetical protein